MINSRNIQDGLHITNGLTSLSSQARLASGEVYVLQTVQWEFRSLILSLSNAVNQDFRQFVSVRPQQYALHLF